MRTYLLDHKSFKTMSDKNERTVFSLVCCECYTIPPGGLFVNFIYFKSNGRYRIQEL